MGSHYLNNKLEFVMLGGSKIKKRYFNILCFISEVRVLKLYLKFDNSKLFVNAC